MKDWLEKFQYDGTRSRFTRLENSDPRPTDLLRSTRINREVSEEPMEVLSVVEQYVLGCYYFLGRPKSFLREDTTDEITKELLRLTGMVKRGKVCLQDGIPIMLNPYEFTENAVQAFENLVRQGTLSPIIKLLFLEQEHRSGKFERMHFYLTNKERVTPKDMHPDFQELCHFLRSTNWPEKKIIALQVSGWKFEELDRTNAVLAMLLTQYEELEIIVSPSTGFVQCIRCFDLPFLDQGVE